MQQLQAENQKLRGLLRELNSRLTLLLQQRDLKKAPEPAEDRTAEAAREHARTSEKQVELYAREHAQLQQRVAKLTDLGYITALQQAVTEKTATLKDHEKQLYQLKQSSKRQEKSFARVATGAEDAVVVAKIQKGMQSRAFEPGPYVLGDGCGAMSEVGVRHFHRLYREALAEDSA